MEVLLSRKGGVCVEGGKQKQMSAPKIDFPCSKSQNLVRELYVGIGDDQSCEILQFLLFPIEIHQCDNNEFILLHCHFYELLLFEAEKLKLVCVQFNNKRLFYLRGKNTHNPMSESYFLFFVTLCPCFYACIFIETLVVSNILHSFLKLDNYKYVPVFSPNNLMI